MWFQKKQLGCIALFIGCSIVARLAWAGPEVGAQVGAGASSLAGDVRYQAFVLNPDLEVLTDTSDGAGILAAGSDGAIWRSTDAGRHWSTSSVPVVSSISAVLGSRQGQRLLAAGDAGSILVSEDGGATWAQRGSAVATHLLAVAAGGKTGEQIIAVGLQGTMTRSLDRGEHWAAVDLGLPASLAAVVFDPRHGRWLIGGEGGILAWSASDGEDWNASRHACRGAISRLLVERKQAAVFAACTDGKILRSSDGGTHWRTVFSGRSDEYVTNLAQAPADGVFVATTAKGGVIRSRDGGLTWKYSAPVKQYLSAIAFLPGKPDHVFVAGDSGTLLQSHDAGVSWQAVKVPDARRLLALFADTRTGTVLASGNGGLIMLTPDRGASWQVSKLAPGDYMHALERDPVSGALVAVGSNRAVARSLDDGASWQLSRLEQLVVPANLSTMLYDENTHAFLVAGGQRSLMASRDGGQTWLSSSTMGETYQGVIIEPRSGAAVAFGDQGALGRMDGPHSTPIRLPAFTDKTLFGGFADGQGTLWVFGAEGILARSTDIGAHWQIVPHEGSAALFAGYADASGRTLIVLGDRGTILRSDDAGQTWQLAANDSRAPLRWVGPSVSGRSLIATGGNGSILRSIDVGKTWVAVPCETGETLRGPILDPARGAMFVVGRGGVILRSADDGLTWKALDAHSTARFKRLWVDADGKLWAHGDRLVRLDPVQ
jgi:photosystem II stability/assembly factor-like uncharacterized protein